MKHRVHQSVRLCVVFVEGERTGSFDLAQELLMRTGVLLVPSAEIALGGA
jgi:hypothetical protein